MLAIGPFQLEEPLARGGMGEVWLGRHERQGVAVAVKLLPRDADDPGKVATFHVEARAVASLDHPGIVHVFDFGEVPEGDARRSDGALTAGRPWIAMELVDGGTLAGAAREATWREVRRFLEAALDALAHAHARGVVHRDLKIGNVLRARDGRYKLTDFGIAHLVDGPTHLPQSGTPSVMAPEQFEGRWRDFGPWTDLYALGALGWTLVTGRRLFPGRSWAEQRESHLHEAVPALRARFAVPEGLDGWLGRLLAKDPADRFRCAADAAWALAGLRDPEGEGTLLALGPSELEGTTLALDTGDGPTASAWGMGDPSRYRHRVAPMPRRWRAREAAPRPPELVGAGLGLWGLRRLPLVGREAERDRLWSALAGVRDRGRAGLVVVRGASGVGKSRLARWLAERARELGAATVLEAVHDAGDGPATGLGAMLRRHLVLAGLPVEQQEARVGAVLDALGVDDPDGWLARTLVRLDGGKRPPVERHTALLRYLEALAVERPVLVLLDDVQWGLDALGFAAAAARRESPILLVLTAAEEALAERPAERAMLEALLGVPGAEAVPVGPLPAADRAELLRRVLGLSPDLVRELDARTDGNPLFAIQVVGEWVQRHQLEPGPDGFRVAEGAELLLPATLREVWERRLERFLATRPAGDGLALRVAALLGREVDDAEWRAACAWLGLRPSEGLVEALLGRRLAVSEDPRVGWAFVHGMLREGVDLTIGEERARLHRACAEAVSDPARRGRHLLAAGELDAAASPLVEGAIRSMVRCWFAEAEDLLVQGGRALDDAGASPADPRRGRALFAWSVLAQQRSDLARADALAAELLELSEQHGWVAERGQALSAMGRSALLRWDLDACRRRFAEAMGICQQLGDREGELSCVRGLAAASVYAGDLDEADGWIARMGELLSKDASALMLGSHHLMVASLVHARLDTERALRELRTAALHFSRTGDRIGHGAVLGDLASCLRETGDLEASDRIYREALALTADLVTDLRGILRMGHGLVLCQLGQAELGLERIREERARLVAVGHLHHLARCDLYLGVALAGVGDPEAREALERALPGLGASRVVQADIAVLLERASALCRGHGWEATARATAEAAASTWLRLGNAARAEAVG